MKIGQKVTTIYGTDGIIQHIAPLKCGGKIYCLHNTEGFWLGQYGENFVKPYVARIKAGCTVAFRMNREITRKVLFELNEQFVTEIGGDLVLRYKNEYEVIEDN